MKQLQLELSGGRTHVEIDGAGPAFVWTHGFTSSIASERRAGRDELWSGLPLEVIRYDARGHGRSGPGRDEAALHWQSLGGELLELCAQLRLTRPIAGGASMGTATT